MAALPPSGFDPDPDPADTVVGAVAVRIVRVARGVERAAPPLHLGLGEAVVTGRPDARLAGGGEFVPWPGDAADPTLPRQAVRVELLVGTVRFTLAERFRAPARTAGVDVTLDGVRLDRAALARPVHEVPVREVGETTVLEVGRLTAEGRPERVRFEVRVQYAARAGDRTLLVADPLRDAATTALRERWWQSIAGLQAGAVVLAAVRLARTASGPVPLRALATAAGRADAPRPDQLVGGAVRSLFEARRGDAVEWDAHLRVLDLADLYSDDEATEENDGARLYARFGDAERFTALVRLLVDAEVVPAGD